MSGAMQLALVLGLFGIPVALLMAGHRVRRTTRLHQRTFWGAVLGHCVAAVLALAASLVPPTGWTPGDLLRGGLGVWGLLVFPAAGALLARLTSPRDTPR